MIKNIFKKLDFQMVVFMITFASLAFSGIWMMIDLLRAPTISINPLTKTKSDCAVLLMQCIMGMLIVMLPSVLSKRLRLEIPSMMQIMLVLFLYGSIYLGKIQNFYGIVPHWDTFLHTLSGAMMGAFGFALINVLNNERKDKVNLSPLFVAIFAFCFSCMLGVIWEIYEYIVDSLLGLNLQYYANVDGTLRVGAEVLYDTMKDMIVDVIGAFVMSAIGYVTIKIDSGWLDNLQIRKSA